MEVSAKTQEENEARVAEEYLSSLSDLTCNSKPLINMLTMLAEENIACASVIVKVVEQHISKVPPDIKLPILYLIDSIVKNVKSTYIHLFSQYIVNIFCDVFEKVNEKIRERMYALRLTWNEVFPSQKLYALDIKVKRIDNNWPITAKQSQPSIHVNPNFLKSVGNVQAGDVEEILQAKTRELLELKKRKLELELEATKKSLEEQDKQLSKVTNGLIPPDASTVGGLRMPGMPPQMIRPGLMPPGIIPQHPMNPQGSHSIMIGAGGGVVVPPSFHPNFHQPRPQQQQHASIGMMAMSTQSFPPSSGNKPKVHPVNPALLNTIRHRDPRLARQQQMQESSITSSMHGSSSSKSSSALSRDDAQKTSSSKTSSYRNGGSSSKNSRNDLFGGGSPRRGDGGSGSESSRHSSYSSNNERHRKSSSSRDKGKDNKDKDRKRSESKSSTSSAGSSSSEQRHKSSSSSSIAALSSSSRSNKKSTSSKCDKDAFEIAPLSTAFKTKSLITSSSSSSRKKDIKRKSQGRNRSRSRSPSEPSFSTGAIIATGENGILMDRDERLAKQPRKINKVDPEIVKEEEENKDKEKSDNKSTVKNIEKNIKIEADGFLAIAAKEDIDLRHFPSIGTYNPKLEPNIVVVASKEAEDNNMTTIAITTTTTTTSPSKVSFKIQKLNNKLETSTAPEQQQPALDNDDEMPDETIATTTKTIIPTATDISSITTEPTTTSIKEETVAPKPTATAATVKSEIVEKEINVSGGITGTTSSDSIVGGASKYRRIGEEGKFEVCEGGGNDAAADSIDSTTEQRSVIKPKSPLLPLASAEAMDIDEEEVMEEEQKRIVIAGGEDKKRLSTSTTDLQEPLAKKCKSTKFDALFGDEDVDLRTAIPPQIFAAQQQHQIQVHTKCRSASKSPTPPPPPFIREDEQNAESWNNLKTSKSTKTSTSSLKKSSNLEDVRAKLAKATKYSKFNKPEKSNTDISRRLSEAQINDDSQDANDEKIRTIVAQAQELLENKSINQDQYKNLMQKVMSINETSKLKEAKKRESLGSGDNSTMFLKRNDNDEKKREEQRALAARDAVLKKRIPKLRRNSIPNTNENKKGTSSPIYDERSDNNNDVVVSNTSTRSKPQREKRQKPSKWGDKVDESAVAAATAAAAAAAAVAAAAAAAANTASINPMQGKHWPKGSGSGPHHSGIGGSYRGAPPPPLMPTMPPQMPWQMQMPPVMPPGSPFVNAGPMIRSSVPPPPPAPPVLPIIPLPPSIPKPCNSIDNPQADLVRTITIDGLSKEIRIYDKVAIVFMELDQPREIGFQAGQRSIIIDDEAPIALQFNDDYKMFSINGQPHRLRFGFPSRELYIDEHWYEIYFGGPPVSIPVQNRIHILKAEGPPPQVNIGALRRDLVVGKINMIVDAHIVIPLFLDAKPQCFKLGNQDHTVQFADNLLTVLLDGEAAKVEYGGLPKSYVLGGISYFIRFGALPHNLKAGQIVIKDMIYVKTEPPALVDPIPPQILLSKQEAIEPLSNADTKDAKLEKIKTDELKVEHKTDTCDTKPDVAGKVSNPESGEQTVNEPQVVGTAVSGDSAIPIFSATTLNKINIDELFQKLVSSGILGGGGGGAGGAGASGSAAVSSNKDAGVLPSAAALEEEPPQPIAICPIDLSKSETIKARQTAIVDTLFCGMQCSSCGVRFPPEQTIKYSQHLDWHFRQNRRERDLSRKAHSRKWYFDLSDWVQYEEIEDLEEREKNFFETQQTDIDACDETSNQKWTNSPAAASLSCPALPDDVDRACDMCQEKFEQFYNEETEEWHLRNATRIEDKIYHPLCYEDFKTSLVAKEEENNDKAKDDEATGEETSTDDVVIIKIEGDDHSDVECKAMESATVIMEDDEDDDVIVLPNEEPSITEIDDDDEHQTEVVSKKALNKTIGIDTENNKETGAEAEAAVVYADADVHATGLDVEIQEPNIPFMDLDTYEEKGQPETDDTEQIPFRKVNIKEEPKDDEDEDDGFEDVGTVLVPADEEISIQSSEETQTQTINSSTSGMSPTNDRPPSSQSIIQVDSTEFAEGSSSNNNTSTTTTVDLNASIDGNTGTEDEHNLSTVGPSPIPLASLVNKIKINIAKSSSSSGNSINNNNNNSGSGSLAAGTTSIPTISSHSMGGNSNSPSRTPPPHDSTACDKDNENTSSLYSNISAISVVSTIPVLCGGGTTTARTTTVVPVSSSNNINTRNLAANEESNVSTISVIGSYGSSSLTPRYFPSSTSSSTNLISTIPKRQPARTTTPPLPPPTTTTIKTITTTTTTTMTKPPQEEEPMTYELKPALKHAKLTKTKKLQCGVETSGLCSIM